MEKDLIRKLIALRRELKEKPLQEVVPGILPEITNMNTLFLWWHKFDYREPIHEEIGNRIEEVLPDTDLATIIYCWDRYYFGFSMNEEKFLAKIKEALFSVVDVYELDKLYCKTSRLLKEAQKLIEDRVKVVLSSIIYLPTLIKLSDSDSPLHKDIKRLAWGRVQEIMPDFVPEATDMLLLNNLCIYTIHKPELQKLIDDRMADLLAQVSLDNTPEWFESLLKREFWLYGNLDSLLEEKITELEKALQ